LIVDDLTKSLASSSAGSTARRVCIEGHRAARDNDHAAGGNC
jgi:hypothetical protein